MHADSGSHQPVADRIVGYITLVLNEVLGSALQSLLGPWEEPINGGAVDKRSEVTDSVPKVFSHWTHANYQMKVVFVHFYEMPELLIQ